MDQQYPALALDDKQLLDELFSLLGNRIDTDPYGEDGAHAAALRRLPIGLRAMAATHHLDVSLTMDDIGWHFLNFGEPGFVEETESGLRVLELHELAGWFAEARDIVTPLRAEIKKPEDYVVCMTRHGRLDRINELTRMARQKGSPIYDAWVKYARRQPQNVFGK